MRRKESIKKCLPVASNKIGDMQSEVQAGYVTNAGSIIVDNLSAWRLKNAVERYVIIRVEVK